jgi:hypothetical protein
MTDTQTAEHISDQIEAVKDYVETKSTVDKQIESRLAERFEILEELTQACINGEARSLIVSGPAGLGKSYTVEQRLASWDPEQLNHTIIKGYVKATGIFKLLYQYRFPNQVIVFDDADSIFFDESALNLLKTVCDSTEKRKVSWMSQAVFIDEESATVIPHQFEFEGTIIFISNYDFDAMIDRGHRLAPHLQALVSRSHYIDLTMKTRRDYLIRIKQVVKTGLLDHLTLDEKVDVISFIEYNQNILRELSLRIAIKIGHLRKSSENWEKIARVTCCK